MSTDPLSLVEKAHQSGLITTEVRTKIVRGFRKLANSIRDVEKASGIPYPRFFVDPVLSVVQDELEVSQLGVIYARNRPIDSPDGLQIWVEFSGALLAFGSKITIEAVAAHEFTHYLELVSKFSTFRLLSDETSHTLFEETYADYGRLIDPSLVFGKRSRLVNLIRKKMPAGLQDTVLENKTLRNWIGRKLPTVRIAPQTNVVSVPAQKALSFRAEETAKKFLAEALAASSS